VTETTEQRILLFLDQFDYGDGDGDAPYEASTAGIGDAVLPDTQTLSESVSLLSALSDLAERGLVESTTAPVVGEDTDRTVHELTAAGRERAARLRDDLRADTIEVRDGEQRTVAVGAFLDDNPDWSLVDVLREVDDGVLSTGGVDDDQSLVDRTDALDAVTAALDDPADADPVYLVGERGIGKTTVLEEATDQAADRGFATGTAQCRAGADEPFGTIRRVLSSAVDGLGDAPFEAAGNPSDDPDEFEAERSAVFERVATAVTDAAERPVLLAIDDLQWADGGTVALLSSLVDRLADAPVVVVGTMRPVDVATDAEVAGLLDDPAAATVELAGFEPEYTRELVARRLGVTDVPGEFVDAVQAHTGGVPLFVTAVVGHLRDAGEVRPEYDIFPADLSAVPDAAEDAISVRLAELPADCRRVLEAAAVVGERIPAAALAAVVDAPGASVATAVDVLADSQLLTRLNGDTLTITSGVVRERVTEELADDRRRRLHRAAADWFASTDGDAERDARAGYHYAAASDHEAAVRHYRRAGDFAADVYANEDALARYERAFDIATEHGVGEVNDVAVSIAEVARALGDYDTADSYFEFVRERSDDVRRKQEMYAEQADLAIQHGDTGTAVELATAGLELGDGEATSERCRLVGRQGWGAMQQGRLEDALSLFEQEQAMAETLGDRERATAFHDLGTVRWKLEQPERARSLFQEAVEYWRDVGDDEQLVRSLNGLGIVEWQTGSQQAAAEQMETALDIAERLGRPNQRSALLNNLGTVYMAEGEWDRALDRYDKALDINRTTGDSIGQAHCLGNIATILGCRAAFDAAETRAAQSRERRREIPDYAGVARAEASLGLIAARRGDVADAQDALQRAREALDDFDGASAPQARTDTELLAAAVALADDDTETAVEHAERAVEAAERPLARGHAALSEARLANGDRTGALAAATDAVQATAAQSTVRDRTWAFTALGRVRRALGSPDLARRALAVADDAASTADATWLANRIRFEGALADEADGRPEQAREALEALREDCRERGLGRLARQCDAALDDTGP
jgi:tetratricopeptide (TPR) repeat protein